MEPVKTRVVEGYYECPVQFTVDIAALQAKYSAVVAGEALVLSLPSVNGGSRSPEELSAPSWHYSEREDLLSSQPELAPFWGRIVTRADGFTTPTAANIRRIGISLTVGGDDDAVRDTGRRIADAMPAWWVAISAWIEVVHGQDLSRIGSVQPGIKFSGVTLWSRLYTLQGRPLRAGGILPVGSSAFAVVWPNYRPITARQLQLCIDHAQLHGPPPAEWLLIRDANSLCLGQDYRRAVLDAGLAAELAVTALIRTHLAAAGHADIDGELRAHRMLGKLCEYWTRDCGGTLPLNYRSRLIERRNAATHAGSHLPEADARDAITVAREILVQASPLPF
ncbi:hypothetical protein OK015_28795 (plasmid) [Mycobacterium sp. Aquia_216]|uniref:hypothetical protein n=1 Tax=Mycobacterium sp. Aquia_216 TaxID=2991729 RepID=UPI00227AF021|nr:hypothetical protein [Mycobacterium sp. Aquia_216]WAJ47952.1 hypothetical protein OK015_28795 [Mycobacterium sp. Aquia_216]